ncbi:MAG: serine hydrolase domain-containing protein [Flavobacteriaceae bacterium]
MKLLKRLLLLGVLALAVISIINYPKLNIISGYAAKNMASSVYVAHRSAESVTEQDHKVPLIELATTEISDNGASAAVWGLKERIAHCQDGHGCTLVPDGHGTPAVKPLPQRTQSPSPEPYPWGHGPVKDTLFAHVDYQLLEAAVDLAFAEPQVQRTRTLLVLHKNHLIAERYAEGFDKDTPILGWSMTKSVLATLYGILEHQGKLGMNERPNIPEWQQDNRKDITFDHLLRMQSGLAWDEDYSSISDVTEMLFLDMDMTKKQAEKEALAAPTEIWNYSSGTSNLLSGQLRNLFNDYPGYLNFPYSQLIDKIGMHSMLIETDMSGNFVGSSYGWASTRDWARFGLLYLNRGNWKGEQLFSPQWVDYIAKPTLHSDGEYGAHFWLNAGGKYPDVPLDLYSANGYQGQYVFIIPSKELVVVRTGLAEAPDFKANEVLSQIIRAIKN